MSTAEVGDGDVADAGDRAEAKSQAKAKGKGKSKLQESVTAQDEGGESVTADDESVTAEGGGEAEDEGDGEREGKGDGAGEEGAGEKSESEMSVLVDEEPKKGRSKGKKGTSDSVRTLTSTLQIGWSVCLCRVGWKYNVENEDEG